MIKGKRILITAGPTYERIDPVRFIGNFSSGKMGFALANELQQLGAEVILVAGPVQQATPLGVQRIDVMSAEEMFKASFEQFATCHAAIMCAAVADYTPVEFVDTKIKRKGDEVVIRLKPTKDIAAHLGAEKKETQVLVGFALETNDESFNAKRKLESKNLDFIVLNSLQDKGAGFAHDTNKITIFDNDNSVHNFELKSKAEVAKDIAAHLSSKM